MGYDSFLFSKIFGLVVGLVVCECLAGLSASIAFGLFENKIDYVKKKGPIAFAGFLTGAIYFFLCYFVTQLLFLFEPNNLSVSEFAIWFNYASWTILLVVLVGKRRASPVVAFAVIFGYFITDFVFLMLTH